MIIYSLEKKTRNNNNNSNNNNSNNNNNNYDNHHHHNHIKTNNHNDNNNGILQHLTKNRALSALQKYNTKFKKIINQFKNSNMNRPTMQMSIYKFDPIR